MNKSRLDKFQGSSSISSEDYFGDGSRKKSSGASSYGVSSYTAPDMTAIKQDLKEGVTRVAGRLSNMASNVMSSFQVRSIHSFNLNHSVNIVFYLFIFVY